MLQEVEDKGVLTYTQMEKLDSVRSTAEEVLSSKIVYHHSQYSSNYDNECEEKLLKAEIYLKDV